LKIFLITILLASILFSLIIGLDLIMGISGLSLHSIIWKAVNPFQVMEPSEYIILFLFLLFFILESIGAYLNKKKGNNSSN
jgi:uncharacterized membrane protein